MPSQYTTFLVFGARPTISSLQIGHASLVDAARAAAAALSPSLWSREILELRSWASVEGWEEELTDTELAVGESRLEFLGGYAGESDLPLPSTLPPPSFRADISPYISWGRDKVQRHLEPTGTGLAVMPIVYDYISGSQILCFCSRSCIFQASDNARGLSGCRRRWLTDTCLADSQQASTGGGRWRGQSHILAFFEPAVATDHSLPR